METADEDDMQKTNDLVAALTEERERNSELEFELEKLLDDIDRFQDKLDKADDAVDELLLENKKMKITVGNLGSKKEEFEKSRREFEGFGSKITEQQRTIDNQEQRLEEQDFLIRTLEHEVDKYSKQESSDKKERLSAGRKSYHMSAAAKKDATIAALQAQIEELQEAMGPSGAKRSEVDEALQKIAKLETVKEELECDNKCLKESLEELRKAMKKAKLIESKLSSMANLSSGKPPSWKLRKETAALKLQTYREEPDISSTPVAPQALLLQSAIARQDRKTNTWGFGALWGGKNTEEDVGALFKDSRNNGANDTRPLSSSKGAMDEDFQAVKEINRRLKEANVALQASYAKLEKEHKKEDHFNQKLIIKLQKDNEKLLKKIEGPS